jgi:hypothetical protein
MGEPRLGDADRRGLTPLFTVTMTPYGEIQLNLDPRLDLPPAACRPPARTMRRGRHDRRRVEGCRWTGRRRAGRAWRADSPRFLRSLMPLAPWPLRVRSQGFKVELLVGGGRGFPSSRYAAPQYTVLRYTV